MSRGPIVEEPALVEALRTPSIAEAAFDAFDQEPLPPVHPLLLLDDGEEAAAGSAQAAP